MKHSLHSVAKTLPKPIRRLVGYGWDYSTRVVRWITILRNIRGQTARDQLVLIASALASPIISWRHLGHWQDPVLLSDAAVHVHGIGNFRLRRRTDDLWHVLPSRETTVLGTIQKHLSQGAVFVDAGANIGVYTVLASGLVGENGHVIAVEMMPETARILRDHISANQIRNAVVVEQALSDVEGKDVIARVPGGQHGQASIATGIAEGGREVRVKTATLTQILSGVDQVALMKMDLEGAEELALAGAGDALKKVRAVIFEDWGDARLSELFRLKGFSVERLDGNNCLATNLALA